MAELGPEPCRSADVAAELSRAPRSLGPLRDGLIKKGMIFVPSMATSRLRFLYSTTSCDERCRRVNITRYKRSMDTNVVGSRKSAQKSASRKNRNNDRVDPESIYMHSTARRGLRLSLEDGLARGVSPTGRREPLGAQGVQRPELARNIVALLKTALDALSDRGVMQAKP